MQKSQQQFGSKSHSLLLSLFCLVAVVDIGRVSAQTNTVAPSSTAAENFVHNSPQMKLVKDPFMRTQQPLDSMMSMRSVRMNKGVLDSVGMVTVYFRVNSSTVEPGYMNNVQALEMLNRTFSNRKLLCTFDYMIITAGASPEGGEALNEQLAAKRALALKSYIMWKYPYVDRSMIYTFSIGEDWAGLRTGVADDSSVPYRSEVLSLLDSSQSTDVKKVALKKIGGGRAYSYIAQHILPTLRGGAALAMHEIGTPVLIGTSDTVYVVHSIEQAPRLDTVKTTVIDTVYVDKIVTPEPVKPIKKPLLAVKTNLLFDATSLINIEAEVPIGRKWSVAGEWIFPWWLWESEQIAVEVGLATLEVRRWLGKRDTKQPLTGWFVGVHGGGGYYDLEMRDSGHQGELWYAGLSGGYAHTINRTGSLRMEYSLGLGYMDAHYTAYVPKKEGDKWNLMPQREAKRIWIGPTRAKVSLMWILNRGNKKKGDVQ
jgi:hypothetical protein